MVNIVTGSRDHFTKHLTEYQDVEAGKRKFLIITPCMWVMWVCYTVAYQVYSYVSGTLVLWKAVNVGVCTHARNRLEH